MFQTFYLGTSEPGWLGRVSVPLFVSKRRLDRKKSLPRALGRWALDSGGFTEIAAYGAYSFTAREYVNLTRRCIDEIGNLDWAAIMDWMCEDIMLRKTGLTIEDHQVLTCESYDELTYLAPEINWVPVLQGRKISDYFRHLDMYQNRGVDLTQLPLTGVGSVCRRQNTQAAATIFKQLNALGLRMHGFGVKSQGLSLYRESLVSADSQAWSFLALRDSIRLPECTHKGKNCSWCLVYALKWRESVLASL